MITVIILSITLVFGIWVCVKYQENIPSTVSVNLVSEKGMCTPAFLGYKFTPKLTAAIKDGSTHTNLYEVNLNVSYFKM